VTIRKQSNRGSILIDVLLAAVLVALIVTPVVSLLVTSHKTTTEVEQRLEALTLAQSHLEELLAAGPEAWISQPFCILPDKPEFELAVNVDLMPARMYKIHVLIRRGDVPYDQTLELATLATTRPQQ
jgi:type II secretory pathway pseudopilin PulG